MSLSRCVIIDFIKGFKGTLSPSFAQRFVVSLFVGMSHYYNINNK